MGLNIKAWIHVPLFLLHGITISLKLLAVHYTVKGVFSRELCVDDGDTKDGGLTKPVTTQARAHVYVFSTHRKQALVARAESFNVGNHTIIITLLQILIGNFPMDLSNHGYP